MTGVLVPIKPYSRRLQPSTYDPGFFSQEFQNVQQSISSLIRSDFGVANVLDYPGRSGQDITRPILNAFGDKGAAWLPPGSWTVSDNITFAEGNALYGIPHITLVTPTSALSGREVFTLGANTTLKGIKLLGTNTTGTVAIGSGNFGISNIVTVSDCECWSFTGVGGRGVKLGFLVTGNFHNIYSALNEYNLECNGGNSPTDIEFDNCQWRQATKKGVWVKTGVGVNFNKNLFEANAEEGFYIQNVGGNATEIRQRGSWYEGNWASLPSGVLRHAQYSFVCDGDNGPSGTIRPSISDSSFNGDNGTTARAMRLTTAIAFVVDNTNVRNEAGQIVTDGSSFGKFPNWAGQNGDFRTTVTNTSGCLPIVTGSRGGNAALASLLTLLATRGDLVDSST